MNSKVAAVVVTFNRLELLKECISSIRKQTYAVNEIIIVNNSSTDGTKEWLTAQNDLTVITQENSGSAGGQFAGIKAAYENGNEFVWCIDTDIVFESDALEKMFGYNLTKEASTGFISSTIYFTDGNLAYPNIPELVEPYSLLNSISSEKPVPILSASFGSLLIRRDVIKKAGYPCREFFIWGDDAEFTLRIIKQGYKGFMIVNSKATHYCGSNNPKPYLNLKTSDIKFLFGVRNMVYVAILRNTITHRSRLRGYLSGLLFVIRLYKDQLFHSGKPSLNYLYNFFILYFKGIFFNPKIEFPEK